MRKKLRKIGERKKGEKDGVEEMETRLRWLSICLTKLLLIQFTLNLGQTTVYINVDRRAVGTLSLAASINTFTLAVLGKLAFNSRRMLQERSKNLRRLDKAEDTFTMELSDSLEDGKLNSEEVRKLGVIYADVCDVVNGSSLQLVKTFSHISKMENGSGTDHPTDSGAV